MKLKPIREQVVVVTGASSGIGRETALSFAARGAKVVAAARGEPGLASLIEEITAAGGEAAYAVCDVADPVQVQAVADLAEQRFGRIDTWVNNAGVSIYARFRDTTPEEFQRVMQVNYLGQIHGALAALPALDRAGGGALISISSLESIVALPLQAAYAASKHAVEGAMDCLRRELIDEGARISVTSIKPATINTPIFTNARSKIGVKPRAVPPVYEPSVVADCVLFAAENPVRELYAGGAAKALAAAQMLTPSLLDAALGSFGVSASRTNEPVTVGSQGNLDSPRTSETRVRGDFASDARASLYTRLETSPGAKAVLATGAVAGAILLAMRRSGRRAGQ